MPTNILRKASDTRPPARPRAAAGARTAVLSVGRVSLRLQLMATDTADRVWAALPIHSTAETWGACIHFETPVETGRDRTAKLNGAPGEIYFWSEDDRILIPFGPTAISRPGECRLPRPCNVWATTADDVTALGAIRPGEKISLVAG